MTITSCTSTSCCISLTKENLKASGDLRCWEGADWLGLGSDQKRTTKMEMQEVEPNQNGNMGFEVFEVLGRLKCRKSVALSSPPSLIGLRSEGSCADSGAER